MKFRIERSSDDDFKPARAPVEGCIREGDDVYGHAVWTLEIADLNELLDLAQKTLHPLIITPAAELPIPTAEIYDDYRE